ncbi:ribosomal 60S subunit protein L24A [Saccharomycopsis crataegensis]|uniref:Ribosomal 60S subunit protein L24A n=1 Tax=Saccharomycopsis crataegensis TaxID=43959 RepID=A0AAV5QNE1_9ASCO|nr:ribosomal 60S subunit protein L24A [Saccharomycopsis crataegensis]
MKIELDSFSGTKIYPGRGTLYVRGDSKTFRFHSSKSASLFLQKKNPRRISWTQLYRRHHKKGMTEEVQKKRSRKTIKNERAIVGVSLETIRERRSVKPEIRKATRDADLAAAKEKKKIEKAKRKAAKAKAVAGQSGAAKVSKQGAKGAFQKVQATSR